MLPWMLVELAVLMLLRVNGHWTLGVTGASMDTSNSSYISIGYLSTLGRSASRMNGASEHTTLDRVSSVEEAWTMSAVAEDLPRSAGIAQRHKTHDSKHMQGKDRAEEILNYMVCDMDQ